MAIRRGKRPLPHQEFLLQLTLDGVQPRAREALVDDILESDVAYFEAAATIEQLEGASIARMAGLEGLAAGCVVQRIVPGLIPRDADGWLLDIEKKLARWNIPRSRLYLQQKAPRLEAALIRQGYRARDELAVMRSAGPEHLAPAEVTLRPIENESDWEAKLALHREIGLGPDGHPSPAELWVRMEREKCETGYMKPYLIFMGENVVGATCAAPWKGILRVKNVAVAPKYRLRGMGTAAILLLAELAADWGKAAAGAFVLAGTPLVAMYAHADFDVVARHTEWIKELS